MTWQLPTDRAFRARGGSSPALFVCLWFSSLFLQWFPNGIHARRSSSSWSRDLEPEVHIRKSKPGILRGMWDITLFGQYYSQMMNSYSNSNKHNKQTWGKQYQLCWEYSQNIKTYLEVSMLWVYNKIWVVGNIFFFQLFWYM